VKISLRACCWIVCLIPVSSIAQNHLNFGIAAGPAYSITQMQNGDHNRYRPFLSSKINYYLEFHWQYLFKNEFGLESGFFISTKNAGIKDRTLQDFYLVQVDGYHFPFLFVLKKPHPKDPYKEYNYLVGTTIEYQYFLEKNKLEMVGRHAAFVPNITLGARISFKKGEFGKIECGITTNYALNGFFKIGIPEEQGKIVNLNPQIHYIKIDLIYYFYNNFLE